MNILVFSSSVKDKDEVILRVCSPQKQVQLNVILLREIAHTIIIPSKIFPLESPIDYPYKTLVSSVCLASVLPTEFDSTV